MYVLLYTTDAMGGQIVHTCTICMRVATSIDASNMMLKYLLVFGKQLWVTAYSFYLAV